MKLLCLPADFGLDERGTARAPGIGDVYFSAEDGLAEARTVFLRGTGLPERWANRRRFTVAELGFGTGLNVLALLALWRRHRPAGGRLDIVSVEGRPLTREQAASALAGWAELDDLARALLSRWPPRWKGAHRRRFDELGATLTVLHEEVEAALEAADFRADAWFLDGFAPSRNPAMWSPAVFAAVARLSAPGARAATFTVAGAVRAGLSDVGFEVQRRPGFGAKRERLEANYVGAAQAGASGVRVPAREGPVLVLGGGVAAASIAHALQARGREVRLVASQGLAAGASGAPAGLLTPRLEAADRPHVRATLAAFGYARTLFQGFDGFYPEGVLRFASKASMAGRLERIASMLGDGFETVEAGSAAALTGVRDAPAGLFMGSAGRFEPGLIVRQLAGEVPVIDAWAHEVRRERDVWCVLDEEGRTLGEAPSLILAGGIPMAPLASMFGTTLEPVAGQVGRYEAGRIPRAALTWGGYVCAAKDAVLLGATHEPGQTASIEALIRLEADARQILPGLADGLGPQIARWTGVRATLRDRLPVAGPLGKGLVILGGLGGRGFAHAPLLAEMIAGDLDGAPAALERSALEALHPARSTLDRKPT